MEGASKCLLNKWAHEEMNGGMTLLPFSGLFKALIRCFAFQSYFILDIPLFRIDYVLNTLDILLVLSSRNDIAEILYPN